MHRRGGLMGRALRRRRPRRSGRGTDPRGRFQHLRAGLQGHGHGGSLHRAGGRSVAAVLQRRRPGVRREDGRSRAAPPGSTAPRRSSRARLPSRGPATRRSRRRSPSSRRTLYWVQPLTASWKFGLGIETPFGLTTSWKNPDQFAGRFLSTKASLQAFDINPTLGWQVTPTFGIGVGGIVRVSKVELNRAHRGDQPVHPDGRRRRPAEADVGLHQEQLRLQHRHPAQAGTRASPGASPTAARSRWTTTAAPG